MIFRTTPIASVIVLLNFFKLRRFGSGVCDYLCFAQRNPGFFSHGGFLNRIIPFLFCEGDYLTAENIDTKNSSSASRVARNLWTVTNKQPYG